MVAQHAAGGFDAALQILGGAAEIAGDALEVGAHGGEVGEAGLLLLFDACQALIAGAAGGGEVGGELVIAAAGFAAGGGEFGGELVTAGGGLAADGGKLLAHGGRALVDLEADVLLADAAGEKKGGEEEGGADHGGMMAAERRPQQGGVARPPPAWPHLKGVAQVAPWCGLAGSHAWAMAGKRELVSMEFLTKQGVRMEMDADGWRLINPRQHGEAQLVAARALLERCTVCLPKVEEDEDPPSLLAIGEFVAKSLTLRITHRYFRKC